MLQAVEHVTAHGQRSRPSTCAGRDSKESSSRPSKRPISATSGENTRTGWAERASMRPGWCLGTPLAEQSLLCAALPASGRIRAPSTSWGDRGRSRPAHVDQLSGRCRPLRKSYAAELSRRSSDTYEFRPADRMDDYSAADFVISEALQQTDFDEIRHGENRIPYRIDRSLTGLAGPEYHAIISFGLPIEPEDSQYGEYRVGW